jgi:hypothetical protein
VRVHKLKIDHGMFQPQPGAVPPGHRQLPGIVFGPVVGETARDLAGSSLASATPDRLRRSAKITSCLPPRNLDHVTDIRSPHGLQARSRCWRNCGRSRHAALSGVIPEIRSAVGLSSSTQHLAAPCRLIMTIRPSVPLPAKAQCAGPAICSGAALLRAELSRCPPGGLLRRTTDGNLRLHLRGDSFSIGSKIRPIHRGRDRGGSSTAAATRFRRTAPHPLPGRTRRSPRRRVARKLRARWRNARRRHAGGRRSGDGGPAAVPAVQGSLRNPWCSCASNHATRRLPRRI